MKDNFCGFDVNCDGRKDYLDDIIFFERMEKEERAERISDDSFDLDVDLMDEDEIEEAIENGDLDPDDFDEY